MRVLGVNCSPTAVLLALCESGSIISAEPERLVMPANMESGQALLGFVEDARRTLAALSPARMALLLPEATNRATYTQLAHRVALETCVRVAAAKDNVEADLLSRPTVRSALGLPRKGSLESHISSVFAAPVGRYWNAGRGLAALAARALEERI